MQSFVRTLKPLNLELKMYDLGIFRLKCEKTNLILKISTLKFVRLSSFVQK